MVGVAVVHKNIHPQQPAVEFNSRRVFFLPNRKEEKMNTDYTHYGFNQQRLAKRERLLSEDASSYPYSFAQTHTVGEIVAAAEVSEQPAGHAGAHQWAHLGAAPDGSGALF